MKTNILRICMTLSCIFFIQLSYSQMPYIDTSWVAQGPVGDTVAAHSSSILVNGKLVMTGNVVSSGGDTDIITVKFNQNGDTLWSATYDGSAGEDDYGIELVATSSGDIIVVGTAQTTGGGYDYAVIKYNGSTGSQSWAYTWDGTGNGIDIPANLVLDGSNRIYVAGGSQASTSSGGMSDYGVIKVTPSGSLSWASYYDYNDLHDAASDLHLQGNKVTVTGASMDTVGVWDIATVKFYQSSGSQASVTRTDIDSVTLAEAYSMVDDEDNNIYITGFAEVDGDKHIQTIKLDSALDIVWVEDYDGDYDDIGRDITLDASGNVYVTGYSGKGGGQYKAVTIKYSSDGNELWAREYGRTDVADGAQSYRIVYSDSGHIYITGSKLKEDTVSSYFFNQYNTDGYLLLSSEFESIGVGDSAYDIHVDADTVYVTGLADAASNPTLTAIKYTLLQDVDYSYYYGDGRPTCWSQQPGMYAFSTTDSSEVTGLLDTTIVANVEFEGDDGYHLLFFNEDATESEIDSVITIIEDDSLFNKEYMVGILNEHNYRPHTDQRWVVLTDYIMVSFKDSVMHADSVDAFADDYDLTLIYTPPSIIKNGVYLFEVERNSSPTYNMDQAAHIWEEESDELRYCHPDMKMFRTQGPDDNLYGQMWFAENTGIGTCEEGASFTNDADCDLDKAWNIDNEFGYGVSWSGEGVRVGVIDFNGYQYDHPDMDGVFDEGFSMPGVVPFNDNKILAAGGGHGHCVAGIIGANANNAEGTAGVAHNCTIVPVLLPSGSISSIGYIVAAIEELTKASYEIDIINMSFAALKSEVEAFEADPLKDALDFAYYLGRGGKGIVLVASSMNKLIGYPPSDETALTIPACYGWTLSVGATTPKDKKKEIDDDYDWASGLDWSSMYNSKLDVCAPGVCIQAPDIETGSNYGYIGGGVEYMPFQGTSAAAPIASGVAALILEKNSDLLVDEVYNMIKNGAEQVGDYTYYAGTGKSQKLGHGRINAFKSLSLTTPLESEEYGFENTDEIYFNNPADDFIYLTVPNFETYSITIVSLQGQVCFEIDGTETFREIEIGHLKSGMYLLSITDKSTSEVQTKKLIVN